MPYIITTTKRPDERPSRVGHADDERVTSRRAVATLEEARTSIARDLHERPNTGGFPLSAATLEAVHTLPESGGTVGPLPDGTVIEVQRVVYNWLIGVAEDNGATFDEDASCAEILDAYNSQAGS